MSTVYSEPVLFAPTSRHLVEYRDCAGNVAATMLQTQYSDSGPLGPGFYSTLDFPGPGWAAAVGLDAVTGPLGPSSPSAWIAVEEPLPTPCPEPGGVALLACVSMLSWLSRKRQMRFRSGTLRQVGVENYRRQQRRQLLVELSLMTVLASAGVWLVWHLSN